ncbi:MAG: hypothetical protein EOR51_12145 [Mesorhizobium sp.]|uniref:hypothetical protein n=1 Tax=Mesorhizobium sp. TaxID=1871066 RepID=UPI000FE7CEF4|nr:hypothetical protein [Mesorhizobium sp.]RWK79652.1 MAG: hypothetical protein EOR50_05875 [Mesorhizobium sp.]RWK82428.1 MAG: hypothetical protein EOR51_12145 [Mesorhizobium sp.]RWL08753.1 MAG: hypothetical protein EOR55_03405 [Mesorhizobium sp.]
MTKMKSEFPGGVLPPSSEGGINREPSLWWRNRYPTHAWKRIRFPTHALNPETGLYDRTPEFKVWWENLNKEEQRGVMGLRVVKS